MTSKTYFIIMLINMKKSTVNDQMSKIIVDKVIRNKKKERVRTQTNVLYHNKQMYMQMSRK